MNEIKYVVKYIYLKRIKFETKNLKEKLNDLLERFYCFLENSLLLLIR